MKTVPNKMLDRTTMRAVLLPILALAIGSIAVSSCSDTPTDSSGSATAGVISGKVTDSQGNPLKGVKVSMFTTTVGGGYTEAASPITSDDGRYSAKVPDAIYAVTAMHNNVTYNGRKYRFELHPVDGIDGSLTHDSRNGYVKDFVWKISGEDPGYIAAAGEPHHYGGHLDLRDESGYTYDNGNYQPYAPKLVHGSTVEITLTPDGPMIDGSQGTVVTRTYELENVAWMVGGHHLQDIPLGRYNVSARITEPDGSVKSLRVSTKPGNDLNIGPTTPGATSVLEFLPVDSDGVWGTKLYLMY